jgi:hypothetical protein
MPTVDVRRTALPSDAGAVNENVLSVWFRTRVAFTAAAVFVSSVSVHWSDQ